jgi:predicted nucleic acid-binding protein
MIVVADTSPFVALANIGRADLLPALFGRVIVPPEVLDELGSPKRPGAVRALVATPPDWLEVRAPTAVEPIAELHAGETGPSSASRGSAGPTCSSSTRRGGGRPPSTGD